MGVVSCSQIESVAVGSSIQARLQVKLKLKQHLQLEIDIDKFLAMFLFKSSGNYRYRSRIEKLFFKIHLRSFRGARLGLN